MTIPRKQTAKATFEFPHSDNPSSEVSLAEFRSLFEGDNLAGIPDEAQVSIDSIWDSEGEKYLGGKVSFKWKVASQ